ncbi:hypothetical protein CFP56_037801 [Quercus suber]|uniref:Ribosomal protein L33 n=1 Tax=Quercus suber TaxID=58331 RepID=A0AAW0J3I6_QUESU
MALSKRKTPRTIWSYCETGRASTVLANNNMRYFNI